MKVYTKTGDKGFTRLIGGEEVAKHHPKIECIGAIDEVCAQIGLLRSKLEIYNTYHAQLLDVQNNLMHIMSHLALSEEKMELNHKLPHLPKESIAEFEKWIDSMEDDMESPSEYFLLPGTSELSALAHLCRTRTRSAERLLTKIESINPSLPFIKEYINRLSDVFYVLARKFDFDLGVKEEVWRKFIYKA